MIVDNMDIVEQRQIVEKLKINYPNYVLAASSKKPSEKSGRIYTGYNFKHKYIILIPKNQL